ncbi:MAG TPA: VOC family protein [Dehalococcoidia bacterium]|nr:VOC family protein [Dehalococcoidia bacterium]
MSEDWARPVVHWEIRARGPQAMRAFYGQMFNWQIGDGPIMQIAPGIGAPEQLSGHILQHASSGVTLYVQVLDLDASIARAKELGGAQTAGKFDVPGGPTIAGISDPEGNPIVLVQQ